MYPDLFSRSTVYYSGMLWTGAVDRQAKLFSAQHLFSSLEGASIREDRRRRGKPDDVMPLERQHEPASPE